MRQWPGVPVFTICLPACTSLLVSTIDGDGDVRAHDGSVDTAKLATVSTKLLG